MICKNLCEVVGPTNSLKVKSAENVGSKFSFLIYTRDNFDTSTN